MRTDGTTRSLIASHLAESIAGAMTIRAFGEEERFFLKTLNLIDRNASPYFQSFSANEWLIQRLEILCAIVLSSSALAMTLLQLGASTSG
jgi:ATP-binding cassette subfamily C (CFTR/MRP) protein 2